MSRTTSSIRKIPSAEPVPKTLPTSREYYCADAAIKFAEPAVLCSRCDSKQMFHLVWRYFFAGKRTRFFFYIKNHEVLTFYAWVWLDHLEKKFIFHFYHLLINIKFLSSHNYLRLKFRKKILFIINGKHFSFLRHVFQLFFCLSFLKQFLLAFSCESITMHFFEKSSLRFFYKFFLSVTNTDIFLHSAWLLQKYFIIIHWNKFFTLNCRKYLRKIFLTTLLKITYQLLIK